MGDYEDDEEIDTTGMTETEIALAKAKRKAKKEEAQFILEYEERRAEERAQLDQELEDLRERQARRMEERMEDEARMQEMMQLAEERRRAEEEDQKRKREEIKRKKEADRKKKQDLMAGGMVMTGAGDGKPNYVLPTKEVKADEMGIKPMSGAGEGPEDYQKAKAEYMQQFSQPCPGLDELDVAGLRTRLKALHKKICDLEAYRYDMEQRIKIQAMDFKELNERKKQKLRQFALKKGLDPDEYSAAKHPFKINVASAYDRQTDRRSYSERKDVYGFKQMKQKTVYHGTARPPPEWGLKKFEEIEILRKLMEENPPKYEEQCPIEGAKPPVAPIPAKLPEVDEEVVGPPLPQAPPPEVTMDPPPAEAPPAAAE